VQVRDSTDVSVSNSHFTNLGNGLSHLDSDRLTITNNTFNTIRVDGIHGGGTSDVLIANNIFSSFYRNPGEHPDAIQFWTTNTDSSAHDIVIRDNLIIRGDGNPMQGIFVGDESKGKHPFINLTITGNTVVGSMYNGIAVSQASHALISDNTVVGYMDMKAWIIVSGAADVTIANNVTSQLSLGAGNVNLTKLDNQIVPLTSAELETYSLAWHIRWEPWMYGGNTDPFSGYGGYGDGGGFYAMAPSDPGDASTTNDVAATSFDADVAFFSSGAFGGSGWTV